MCDSISLYTTELKKKLNRKGANFEYFLRLSDHRTFVLKDFWRWSFSEHSVKGTKPRRRTALQPFNCPGCQRW